MTERLTLSDGPEIKLGRLIASGGEGSVYEVAGRAGFAVKVYHEAQRTSDRAAKLEAMLAAPPENIRTGDHLSIAWPIELVQDATGRVVGFTMPLASDARELSSILNPQSRAQVAPGMTWQHLLTVARNVSAVVDALHAAGYILGDLSERNFLVTRDALVTLIDCDSIQVPSLDGKVFISPVGTARFTAPELLGIDFESQERTVEGDRFALAVLIFLILSEGYHPFQGVPRDDSFASDDISAIRLGAYAYSPAQTILGPPPAAPDIESLPPVLAQFFEKTFVHGHRDPSQRTTAAVWQSTLDSISRSLQVCTREPRHAFWSLDQHCPWCVRAERIGVDTWKLASVPRAVTPVPPSPRATAPTRQRSAGTSPPRPPPPPQAAAGSGSRDWRSLLPAFAGIALAAVGVGAIAAALLANSGSAVVPESTALPSPTAAAVLETTTQGPTETATSETATPRPTPRVFQDRWISNTGGVGVRARIDCSEASASGGLAVLPEGLKVGLLEIGNGRCTGWSLVRRGGEGEPFQQIWVDQSYLRDTAPTSPVPTPGPTQVSAQPATPEPTPVEPRPDTGVPLVLTGTPWMVSKPNATTRIWEFSSGEIYEWDVLTLTPIPYSHIRGTSAWSVSGSTISWTNDSYVDHQIQLAADGNSFIGTWINTVNRSATSSLHGVRLPTIFAIDGSPLRCRGAPPCTPYVLIAGSDSNSFSNGAEFEVISGPEAGAVSVPVAICTDSSSLGGTHCYVQVDVIGVEEGDGFTYRFTNSGRSSAPASVVFR